MSPPLVPEAVHCPFSPCWRRPSATSDFDTATPLLLPVPAALSSLEPQLLDDQGGGVRRRSDMGLAGLDELYALQGRLSLSRFLRPHFWPGACVALLGHARLRLLSHSSRSLDPVQDSRGKFDSKMVRVTLHAAKARQAGRGAEFPFRSERSRVDTGSRPPYPPPPFHPPSLALSLLRSRMASLQGGSSLGQERVIGACDLDVAELARLDGSPTKRALLLLPATSRVEITARESLLGSGARQGAHRATSGRAL